MLHSSPVLRAYKTASWVTSDEILIKPYPEWSGKNYQVNGLSKAISIKRNHIFDLGNFNFNVSYNCGQLIPNTTLNFFSFIRAPFIFCFTFAQVVHLPGHTTGSIGLVEENKGILLTGNFRTMTRKSI